MASRLIALVLARHPAAVGLVVSDTGGADTVHRIHGVAVVGAVVVVAWTIGIP